MATNGTSLNLVDVAKRLDPDGKLAKIAELLNQTNPLLDDIPWVEGNLPTGDRTTVRTGLPSATWRLLNGGVSASKSVTAQVDEAVGLLEAYGECDAKIAEMAGDIGAFRLSEALAHIEGMNQTMATGLLYGKKSSPEQIVGLMTRFNSLSANNATNIINASGTVATTNTSILLVGWHPETVCGIYGKGAKAGLSHEDKGKVTLETTGGVSGARSEIYRDHWVWECGVRVKDWRHIVRIANINTASLTKTGTTGADLVDLMMQALELLPNSVSNPVFYVPRTIRSFLRRQIANKTNVWLDWSEVAGRKVMTIGDGVAVKRLDAITTTEDVIS